MTPVGEIFTFPPKATLTTFKDIWFECFIYFLISSLIVHIIAAAVATRRLRKHHWGRFTPVFILVFGVISPLTCGTITSAAIAGIYKAGRFDMAPIYSLVWGVAQTVTLILISFTRVLITL